MVMAAALAAGGLALFDLNSLLAYRTTFASHSISESGETVRAVGPTHASGPTARDVVACVRKSDGIDSRPVDLIPRDD